VTRSIGRDHRCARTSNTIAASADTAHRNRGTPMPNGGIDNCGVCGFNRANEGVWERHDYLSIERLDNAFCTIRDVRISNALWTYCANCHSKERTPTGPICIVGLHEEAGYLYSRIPWHGGRRPTINVPGTCGCGRFAHQGIAIETDEGEQHFCCNGHYVEWWRRQHPNESYEWDVEWPETGQSI
jgi:hypothetical protein